MDGADEDSQEQLQEQLLESGGPEEEQKTDNTSLLRLLEEGEKVSREHTFMKRDDQNYNLCRLDSAAVLCFIVPVQHIFFGL